MTAFDVLLSDPSFAFIREQWHEESAVKIHKHGGRKQAGDHTASFHRIITDSFIRWLPLLDENGVTVGRTHRPPRTTDEPDEFVMPAHEAMKREKPDMSVVGMRGTPEYRWLRETIAWRYLPCMCNCVDVVAHLAQRDHTTPDNVVSTVIATARRAVLFLQAHDAVPESLRGIPARQVTKVAWRRASDTPTLAQLAHLPRVFWPCGCTELERCAEHASSATAAA